MKIHLYFVLAVFLSPLSQSSPVRIYILQTRRNGNALIFCSFYVENYSTKHTEIENHLEYLQQS